MQLTSRLPHALTEPRSAVALLGAEHPLVRVSNRLATVLKQSLVSGAVLAASTAAASVGVSGAFAYVVAAALVQAALACGMALLRQSKRELVLDLIIEGLENLPLATVERQRRRLLDPRTQVRLAASLDSVIEEALAPPRVPALSPVLLIDPAVVRPVVQELHVVVSLLRLSPEQAAGVAAAERMLTDGESALYGDDHAALREQLGRIRYQLQARWGDQR